jgi:hypothetical protein
MDMRGNPLATYIVALGCALLCAPTAASGQEIMRCRLLEPGSESLKTADCMACHDGKAEARWTGDPDRAPPTLHQSHRVDVDYARATATKRRARLREPAEAVRRGAFLPDGFIRCTTCHDRHSTAKLHLSLPTETSRQPVVGVSRNTVDATPLCVLCHAHADG